MKGCKFGFSAFSFSYLYILFSVVLYVLRSCILSFSELSSTETTNIFRIEPIILKHGLIKLMVEYLGYVIFGGIFFYIFTISKIFKEKREEKNKNNKQLIFFKKQHLTWKKVKLLLIASSLYSVQLVIRYIMYIMKLWPLDLWIFNIIFISLFMKMIFKIAIYKHRLYSLGCNFIINLILLIIASSLKISNVSEYDSIANNFGSYAYIALFYLAFLALSGMICLSQVMQKKLMDVKNVSPFTILFIIGAFNTFFIIIALIITSTIKCNEALINKGLCSLIQTDSIDKSAYFDSFKIFINNLRLQSQNDKSAFFIEVLLVYPLYAFICNLKFLCDIIIIYHLNPIYILISDNTYFSIKMIISLINNPSDISNLLKLVGEIISLFTYFFYLEIIELKCCNMNFNTRAHINERSLTEALRINTDNDDDISINNDNDINNNTEDNNENEMILIKANESDIISTNDSYTL